MRRAIFQLRAVLAELERSIIQERVKACLERARVNGKILRRPRTDQGVEAKVRKLAGNACHVNSPAGRATTRLARNRADA